VGWNRTFGQIADECLLRSGQRLRRKAPKNEATYLGRLPGDVGQVDARFATASVAEHPIRPSGKQATKRLARELSAHAIDNDVHTPAAAQPHHAVSQALAREVDDMLVAVSCAFSAFALVLAVEIASDAPSLRAICTLSIPTAPPIPGASTLWA